MFAHVWQLPSAFTFPCDFLQLGPRLPINFVAFLSSHHFLCQCYHITEKKGAARWAQKRVISRPRGQLAVILSFSAVYGFFSPFRRIGSSAYLFCVFFSTLVSFPSRCILTPGVRNMTNGSPKIARLSPGNQGNFHRLMVDTRI